jgi:hypothetical protein
MGRVRISPATSYLSLDVWPTRQARNAASACSRSSVLLTLRRGCFEGWLATGVAPLSSSAPCRPIRRRCCIRDQFVRPLMTDHHSKAAGKRSKTGGSALAPQTAQHLREKSASSGLSNRRTRKARPTQQSYTRASRLGSGGAPQISGPRGK